MKIDSTHQKMGWNFSGNDSLKRYLILHYFGGTAPSGRFQEKGPFSSLWWGPGPFSGPKISFLLDLKQISAGSKSEKKIKVPLN